MSARYEAEVRERALRLKALTANWDGDNSPPIDHATIDKAVELALLASPSIPSYCPWLVPTTESDVQVEWHAEGWDIELYVSRSTVGAPRESEEGQP